MSIRPLIWLASLALMATGALAQESERLSPEARAIAYRTLDRAIDYLRAEQDGATGGWVVRPAGVTFPAITGLVVDGMLQHPAIDARDPAVRGGIDFLLSHRQPDGGIYDRMLPSYNTSIALSALTRAGLPETDRIVAPAQAFLVGLQWSEASHTENVSDRLGVGRVDAEHPFYGGVGYGSHGRPDLSNLAFMLQALHDSGYESESPPFRRAVTFLERLQMDARFNDMPYAEGADDGGFIYATGPEADRIGEGQSQAGSVEETLDDGSVVSRLRSYGSMTYAGFKSYLYADLSRDDPRVAAARDWIGRHYTLSENPGLGDEGYYYYLVTFARALDALNEPEIGIVDESGRPIQRRWAEDLVRTLAGLQNDDGSFPVLSLIHI